MIVIEFKNVTKSFNDDVVLRNISFSLRRGETKIILGASGSGKSTILKLILGLIRPDSGQILVDGQDITKMTERELVQVRRKIGMVFQEGALFDSLSLRENVGYRLYEESSMPEEEIEIIVRRVLGFVGLEDAIDKMPSELSGGMKRRAGLARALVGSPRIILYDEPTAGLDPITARSIVDLMIKLRDFEGVTSIFVTHDLLAAGIVATEYADIGPDMDVRMVSCDNNFCLLNIHFVMLYQGEILFEGTLQQLKSSQEHYIREFVH
jgi:phospholipid/cholesterol/gamma-HCH transport system ATP-binding protein